ncbi:protein FAM170A isoform X1 [Oryctolagus cuniculus]|uniref:protein FAM170A isoform X1 n=1 Tax=Oryctolagus cuniculus TaxID=9986 RepID=UPI00387A1462
MKRKQKTKHLESTLCPQSEKTSRGSTQRDPGISTAQSAGKQNSMVEDRGIHQFQEEAPCFRGPESPLLQCLELQQTLLPYQNNCFHYHLANEPCTPEIHRRREREIKVYYTCVQRKREVADLQNTKKGLEPAPRKARVQEMTFTGKIPIDTNLPVLSPWELLTESECGWDVEEEKAAVRVGKEESLDCPAEPPALEESPRARTPEWLVTPESGYKCMGCCRVFPSRTVLQRHVQHGVEEGFSCRAFHLAFAWLKSKRSMKKRRKKKATYGSRKGKGFYRRNSSCK